MDRNGWEQSSRQRTGQRAATNDCGCAGAVERSENGHDRRVREHLNFHACDEQQRPGRLRAARVAKHIETRTQVRLQPISARGGASKPQSR